MILKYLKSFFETHSPESLSVFELKYVLLLLELSKKSDRGDKIQKNLPSISSELKPSLHEEVYIFDLNSIEADYKNSNSISDLKFSFSIP